MASSSINVLMAVTLSILVGCHGPDIRNNESATPTLTTRTATSSPSVEQSLDALIHLEPREGGVREYFAKEGHLEGFDISGSWKSYLSLTGEVLVNWAEITRIVFIPVCNTDNRSFSLYSGERNIAEGPCGPGQVISFAPPSLSGTEKQRFFFKITGATRAEVAVYTERKQGNPNETQTP